MSHRRIVVTGAGQGIGRALAVTLADRGCEVFLLGRTVSNLEQTWDLIAAGKPRVEPQIVPLDMATANDDAYVQVHDALAEQSDVIHGLVHCAGLLGPRLPIQHTTTAAWQETFQVNVTAAMVLSRSLLPLLCTADHAAIVFSSSSVGRQGRAYWGAYAASKFALEGLAQVLADELTNTSKVTVNTVNPGATRTAMRAAAYPAENPESVPAPEQRLAPYLYLLDPESAGVTGQALNAQDFEHPATH